MRLYPARSSSMAFSILVNDFGGCSYISRIVLPLFKLLYLSYIIKYL